MKKYLALTLLVSFAGVHAADTERNDSDLTPKSSLSPSASGQNLSSLDQQPSATAPVESVDGLGGDQSADSVVSDQKPTVSLQERLKYHSCPAFGGGFSAAVLALIAGARDPQKLVPAALVGAVFGMGSKEVLDRVIPQLPDNKFSNMAKGAIGPIGVRYFPNVLDLSSAGTRSIQGK